MYDTFAKENERGKHIGSYQSFINICQEGRRGEKSYTKPLIAGIRFLKCNRQRMYQFVEG